MRQHELAELQVLRRDTAHRRGNGRLQQQAVVFAGPVHKQARQGPSGRRDAAVTRSPAAAAGRPHQVCQHLSQLRPRGCQHRADVCGAPEAGLTLCGRWLAPVMGDCHRLSASEQSHSGWRAASAWHISPGLLLKSGTCNGRATALTAAASFGSDEPAGVAWKGMRSWLSPVAVGRPPASAAPGAALPAWCHCRGLWGQPPQSMPAAGQSLPQPLAVLWPAAHPGGGPASPGGWWRCRAVMWRVPGACVCIEGTSCSRGGQTRVHCASEHSMGTRVACCAIKLAHLPAAGCSLCHRVMSVDKWCGLLG